MIKLSTPEAIAHLRDKHGMSISAPTLSRYMNDPRFKGLGPPAIRLGPRRVFYPLDELDKWANGESATKAEDDRCEPAAAKA